MGERLFDLRRLLGRYGPCLCQPDLGKRAQPEAPELPVHPELLRPILRHPVLAGSYQQSQPVAARPVRVPARLVNLLNERRC